MRVLLLFGLFSRKHKTKSAVIMYKISDSAGNAIHYVNVINDDFSQIWRVFTRVIGKPRDITTSGSGFVCRANKQTYFIDRV